MRYQRLAPRRHQPARDSWIARHHISDSGINHDCAVAISDQIAAKVHSNLTLFVSRVESPFVFMSIRVITVRITPVETVLYDEQCVETTVELPCHVTDLDTRSVEVTL